VTNKYKKIKDKMPMSEEKRDDALLTYIQGLNKEIVVNEEHFGCR